MSLWHLGIDPSNASVGPGELGGEQLESLPQPAPPPAVLGAVVFGQDGVGSGGSYRPHPKLPPADHLEYFDKLVRALIVVVLALYLVRDPGRVLRALKRRAGVE